MGVVLFVYTPAVSTPFHLEFKALLASVGEPDMCLLELFVCEWIVVSCFTGI